jgi:hypothetical protein
MDQSLPNLRHCLGIFLKGVRKTTNLGQDSRSPGRDLHPVPPEEEAVLTTQPQRSTSQ